MSVTMRSSAVHVRLTLTHIRKRWNAYATRRFQGSAQAGPHVFFLGMFKIAYVRTEIQKKLGSVLSRLTKHNTLDSRFLAREPLVEVFALSMLKLIQPHGRQELTNES